VPLIDYPFSSHFHERDGLRLHYLDEGSGPPVVMVHGNPTWSYYYRHLVLGLRDTHRCLVPDHIGCGLSDKPDLSKYDYSLSRRIDDFSAWIESLKLSEKVSLVVHDWGGMIGTAWAVRNPDRIAKMVILNTAAFGLPKTKMFPWALWLCRNTRLGAYLVLRWNAFAKIATWVASKKGLSREEKAAYLSPYDTPANRIATLKFVQTIPLSQSDRDFGIIEEVESKLTLLNDVPKLIMWGMRDFVFDRHFLAEWERRFPDAEVHRYSRAGHYVLDDEREAIIQRTREFLKS